VNPTISKITKVICGVIDLRVNEQGVFRQEESRIGYTIRKGLRAMKSWGFILEGESPSFSDITL